MGMVRRRNHQDGELKLNHVLAKLKLYENMKLKSLKKSKVYEEFSEKLPSMLLPTATRKIKRMKELKDLYGNLFMERKREIGTKSDKER